MPTTRPTRTEALAADVACVRSAGKRVLWVTNLPAPYRLAVWDELVRDGVALEVWVLAANEANRHWGLT